MPRPRASRPAAVAALIAVLAAGAGAAVGVLAGGSAAGAGGSPAATGTIVVSTSACAPGWHPPPSGQHLVTVENASRSEIFEVDLISASHHAVYGEIEMLAPGTEDTMDEETPPGSYYVECESFSGFTRYSALLRVSGPPDPAASSFVPVEVDQLDDAVATYRASLSPDFAALERDTDALLAAVRSGDLALARRRWLPAHLDYERLGAAYDAFGSFDALIDGRPNGLVGGVSSPDFHGFLRLEYGLWHGQPATELLPVAAMLDADVHELVAQFPGMPFPANDLPLRAHEILENALQFELTGEADQGSGSQLATVWANVQGTELTIAALTPLLQASDPPLLRQVSSGLAALAADLHAFEHADGSWTPLAALPSGERQRLDAAIGGLLEELSLIPDRFEQPLRSSGDS